MVTLELVGVEARYGERIVLADLSLPVLPGGELVALVGANAAGKSTFFRRLAGHLAGRGEVRIGGGASLRYMPQDSGAVAALTVYEAVILALKQGRRDWRLAPAERAAVEAVLARLDIEVLASRPLGELSGGQRQLVSLAQTLVGRPGVVLLDEPTSALDLARQYEVLALLRAYAAEEGAVVIVALHDLNQVLRSCSTTVALAEGRILAAGPTAEVLTPAAIARLYGVRARIERCSRGRPVLIVDGPLGADGPARAVAQPHEP